MPKSLSILVLTVPLGCTAVLGIDGNYVGDTQDAGHLGRGGLSTGGLGVDTGGVENGGTPGPGGASSGGIVNTGGTSPAGGSSGAGATACKEDGGSCKSGEKCCVVQTQSGSQTSCVTPAPIVGCNASDCTPCALPDNAVAICKAGQCDFECNPNTTRSGNTCQPNGAGGSGGATTTCNAQSCPGCGIVGPIGCCLGNGSCGCIWPFAPPGACY